jgi:hypothetical protein
MEYKFERLIVGMAYGESSILPMLVIFRENEDGSEKTIINYFIGAEAKEFHDKLFGILPDGQRVEYIVRELLESIDEEKEKENGKD